MPRCVAQPPFQPLPGRLIGRQADPKITLRLMSTTGPENSRVYVSLSKQRAYLINTTTDDYFPIKQMQMGRFTGERWEQFGPVFSGKVGS